MGEVWFAVGVDGVALAVRLACAAGARGVQVTVELASSEPLTGKTRCAADF